MQNKVGTTKINYLPIKIIMLMHQLITIQISPKVKILMKFLKTAMSYVVLNFSLSLTSTAQLIINTNLTLIMKECKRVQINILNQLIEVLKIKIKKQILLIKSPSITNLLIKMEMNNGRINYRIWIFRSQITAINHINKYNLQNNLICLEMILLELVSIQLQHQAHNLKIIRILY